MDRLDLRIYLSLSLFKYKPIQKDSFNGLCIEIISKFNNTAIYFT